SVQRFTLTDSNGAPGRVVMPACDDAFGVWDDSAVVEKHVHVVFGSQQRADVSLQHKVRLDGAFDRLLDLRVGGMDQFPDLLTDGLLPGRQRVDVIIDTRVRGEGHHPVPSFGSSFSVVSNAYIRREGGLSVEARPHDAAIAGGWWRAGHGNWQTRNLSMWAVRAEQRLLRWLEGPT